MYKKTKSITLSYDNIWILYIQGRYAQLAIIFSFTRRGVNDTEIGRDFARLYTRSGDTVPKGSRNRQGAVAYE